MSFKKYALITAWGLAAIAWLAQIPVFLLVSDSKNLMLSLAGAVIMTELAFYMTAALLGLTLLQSRKRIWLEVKRFMRFKTSKS